MTGKMYGYARVSSKEQNLTGSSTRSPSSAWPTIWCSPTKRAGKTSSDRNTNGLFQRFAKTTWSWLLGSGGFSLDVTTARIQNAPFGHVTIASPAQSASFRHITAREARDQTPRQPAGHYGKWPNWANALGQPPARLRGGCAGDPQALAWGLDARKGAVWAEGLAEGAPWAKPGHHQAASRS